VFLKFRLTCSFRSEFIVFFFGPNSLHKFPIFETVSLPSSVVSRASPSESRRNREFVIMAGILRHLPATKFIVNNQLFSPENKRAQARACVCMKTCSYRQLTLLFFSD
jgi:hypothetical protein